MVRRTHALHRYLAALETSPSSVASPSAADENGGGGGGGCGGDGEGRYRDNVVGSAHSRFDYGRGKGVNVDDCDVAIIPPPDAVSHVVPPTSATTTTTTSTSTTVQRRGGGGEREIGCGVEEHERRDSIQRGQPQSQQQQQRHDYRPRRIRLGSGELSAFTSSSTASSSPSSSCPLLSSKLGIQTSGPNVAGSTEGDDCPERGEKEGKKKEQQKLERSGDTMGGGSNSNCSFLGSGRAAGKSAVREVESEGKVAGDTTTPGRMEKGSGEKGTLRRWPPPPSSPPFSPQPVSSTSTSSSSSAPSFFSASSGGRKQNTNGKDYDCKKTKKTNKTWRSDIKRGGYVGYISSPPSPSSFVDVVGVNDAVAVAAGVVAAGRSVFGSAEREKRSPAIPSRRQAGMASRYSNGSGTREEMRLGRAAGGGGSGKWRRPPTTQPGGDYAANQAEAVMAAAKFGMAAAGSGKKKIRRGSGVNGYRYVPSSPLPPPKAFFPPSPPQQAKADKPLSGSCAYEECGRNSSEVDTNERHRDSKVRGAAHHYHPVENGDGDVAKEESREDAELSTPERASWRNDVSKKKHNKTTAPVISSTAAVSTSSSIFTPFSISSLIEKESCDAKERIGGGGMTNGVGVTATEALSAAQQRRQQQQHMPPAMSKVADSGAAGEKQWCRRLTDEVEDDEQQQKTAATKLTIGATTTSTPFGRHMLRQRHRIRPSMEGISCSYLVALAAASEPKAAQDEDGKGAGEESSATDATGGKENDDKECHVNPAMKEEQKARKCEVLHKPSQSVMERVSASLLKRHHTNHQNDSVAAAVTAFKSVKAAEKNFSSSSHAHSTFPPLSLQTKLVEDLQQQEKQQHQTFLVDPGVAPIADVSGESMEGGDGGGGATAATGKHVFKEKYALAVARLVSYQGELPQQTCPVSMTKPASQDDIFVAETDQEKKDEVTAPSFSSKSGEESVEGGSIGTFSSSTCEGKSSPSRNFERQFRKEFPEWDGARPIASLASQDESKTAPFSDWGKLSDNIPVDEVGAMSTREKEKALDVGFDDPNSPFPARSPKAAFYPWEPKQSQVQNQENNEQASAPPQKPSSLNSKVPSVGAKSKCVADKFLAAVSGAGGDAGALKPDIQEGGGTKASKLNTAKEDQVCLSPKLKPPPCEEGTNIVDDNNSNNRHSEKPEQCGHNSIFGDVSSLASTLTTRPSMLEVNARKQAVNQASDREEDVNDVPPPTSTPDVPPTPRSAAAAAAAAVAAANGGFHSRGGGDVRETVCGGEGLILAFSSAYSSGHNLHGLSGMPVLPIQPVRSTPSTPTLKAGLGTMKGGSAGGETCTLDPILIGRSTCGTEFDDDDELSSTSSITTRPSMAPLLRKWSGGNGSGGGRSANRFRGIPKFPPAQVGASTTGGMNDVKVMPPSSAELWKRREAAAAAAASSVSSSSSAGAMDTRYGSSSGISSARRVSYGSFPPRTPSCSSGGSIKGDALGFVTAGVVGCEKEGGGKSSSNKSSSDAVELKVGHSFVETSRKDDISPVSGEEDNCSASGILPERMTEYLHEIEARMENRMLRLEARMEERIQAQMEFLERRVNARIDEVENMVRLSIGEGVVSGGAWGSFSGGGSSRQSSSGLRAHRCTASGSNRFFFSGYPPKRSVASTPRTGSSEAMGATVDQGGDENDGDDEDNEDDSENKSSTKWSTTTGTESSTGHLCASAGQKKAGVNAEDIENSDFDDEGADENTQCSI